MAEKRPSTHDQSHEDAAAHYPKRKGRYMGKHKKEICILSMAFLMANLLSTAVYTAVDVASAVEST